MPPEHEFYGVFCDRFSIVFENTNDNDWTKMSRTKKVQSQSQLLSIGHFL